eukprot:snap_masked-scaffold_28-processed-gene-2.14-mRNA-1 protein AED:0.08 eAED:0.09 QI:0/-1/0/1/-1/1/1/0/153
MEVENTSNTTPAPAATENAAPSEPAPTTSTSVEPTESTTPASAAEQVPAQSATASAPNTVSDVSAAAVGASSEVTKTEEEKPKEEVEKKEEAGENVPSRKPGMQSLPIRQYLDQTVVPVLLTGMSQLTKERPNCDEVEWLAQWMLRNNPNKKK